MPDINPIPIDLKPYRQELDDPHQPEFMTIVKRPDLDTEKLLDEALAFADEHDWKHQQLLDHCFVAQALLFNQLILNGYPEDVPVPSELDRLLRVMSVLSYASSPHLPMGRR